MVSVNGQILLVTGQCIVSLAQKIHHTTASQQQIYHKTDVSQALGRKQIMPGKVYICDLSNYFILTGWFPGVPVADPGGEGAEGAMAPPQPCTNKS